MKKKQTKPSPDFVYAIRVMTTKKGKPRKRKAYARWMGRGNNCRWVVMNDLALLLSWDTRPAHVLSSRSHKGLSAIKESKQLAESALSCKCAVVKIELTEREI